MSEYKITDLGALTVPAQADVLEITDVSASTSAKITIQNLVGQAYADIKLIADTGTQTLTATYAKLTAFDSSTAALNCTVAGDKDSITVTNAGVYQITFSSNFYAATAKTFLFALSVGDSEDIDAQTSVVVPTTGATNVHNVGFTILKTLAAGAVLTIEAKVHSATSATTFNNIDLVVRKIDASA